MKIIPFQLELKTQIPTVTGNKDYSTFKKLLENVDRLLYEEQIEDRAVRLIIDKKQRDVKGEKSLSREKEMRVKKKTVKALKCSIAMQLLGESYRKFAIRLADSALLQHFCGLVSLDKVSVPSKSTLENYSKMFDEEELRELVSELTRNVSQTDGSGHGEPLLKTRLDVSEVFYDTTTLSANIHFPVDWVLLRDAARTLMKAVKFIRRCGLKNRMDSPDQFLKRMNRLCIEMTNSRRKKDAKKSRKTVLRKMKKLSKTIADHAEAHKKMLEEGYEGTALSRAQAENIAARIDGVLVQLPAAVKQAHERIIGERQVKSKDKILSIYEPDIHVIVRGKAGAEVEFGNTLLIAEQKDGVILDWKLVKGASPGDCALMIESLERIGAKNNGALTSAVTGDRGFDSEKTRSFLEENKIENAVCPRSVPSLSEKMKDDAFAGRQTRRGQTEGRIAILKNGFLGSPMRKKGFQSRNANVSCAVLAHNLWVLARMAQKEAMGEPLKKAA